MLIDFFPGTQVSHLTVQLVKLNLCTKHFTKIKFGAFVQHVPIISKSYTYTLSPVQHLQVIIATHPSYTNLYKKRACRQKKMAMWKLHRLCNR